jgi:aspartyl-tRNA(Asn)/glutamyl-tRNA(Gln) amidotransferase subunit A
MDVEAAREHILDLAHLNAFISLTEETGEGPIVAVKDLIHVCGTWTTAGSMMLPFIPDRDDAEVIRQIRGHGCVVVGKTNLHEWAFGATSANLHFGPVRNPHDPALVAGGSSGGSAVAVATGMCDWAIGTDTGGSIRIPAALCGVVGVKPTLGTVSTHGVLPLSRSLDTVGPLAADMHTAARALEMMTGRNFVPEHRPTIGELRLAVPADWDERIDDEVRSAWERVAEGLPRIQLPMGLGRMFSLDCARGARSRARSTKRRWRRCRACAPRSRPLWTMSTLFSRPPPLSWRRPSSSQTWESHSLVSRVPST